LLKIRQVICFSLSDTCRNFRCHDTLSVAKMARYNYPRMRGINTFPITVCCLLLNTIALDFIGMYVENSKPTILSCISTLRSNAMSSTKRVNSRAKLAYPIPIDGKIAFPRDDDKGGRRKRKKTFIIRGRPRKSQRRRCHRRRRRRPRRRRRRRGRHLRS